MAQTTTKFGRRELLSKTNPNFQVLGTGVPNRKVIVAKYTVPPNTAAMLENGAQLVMKLADGSGNEISRDSYVYFYKKQSGFDGEKLIAKVPYSTFFDLAIGDQRNERYKDGTRVQFAVPAYAALFKSGDELQVWVESADSVDFSHANTIFELEIYVRQI